MERSQVHAIALAALMVLSMVAIPALQPTPVSASASMEQTSYQAALDGNLATTLEDDLESVQVGPDLTDPTLLPEERLGWTAHRIDDLEVDDDAAQEHLNESVDHLDASLASYRAHRTTDREAYDRQAEALHALADATGTEHDDATSNASLGIVGTSNQTARIATRHANASATRFESDLDTWDEDDVEQALTDARAALESAENARDEIDEDWRLSRQIRQRGDVVDLYREANHHAERALDVVEANADPRLSLSHGQPVQIDGDLVVSVEAMLTDVRPWTYEDAAVLVEHGNQSYHADPIEFGDGWLTTSFTTGSTILELDPDAANVSVTATVEDGAQEDRVVSDTIEIDLEDVLRQDTRPDGPADVTVSDDETGATVDARGDGLLEADIVVTNETPAESQSYLDSEVVRISNRTAIDNATVTVPVENATETANRSIYTWDPGTDAGWTPVETTVDPDNETASAHVEHFSYFAVFDEPAWNDTIRSTVVLRERHVQDRHETNETTAPGQAQWTSEALERATMSSPTVANGIVYVGDDEGGLWAIDEAVGEPEWHFEEPAGAVESTPAVADGTVYVGSRDGTLYAVDAASGEQVWTYEEPSDWVRSSPAVDGGIVYVTDLDGRLHAVDAESGDSEWTYDAPAGFDSSPTVTDGTVYVGDSNGTLHAVDAASGDQLWTFEEPSENLFSSPTVANGTVFVGSHDSTLYAVDAETGDRVWRYEEPTDWVQSSPTVADGTVYVATRVGRLHAVDAGSGDRRWVADGPSFSSPTVADDTVYVGSTWDDAVYAFDAESGEERWVHENTTGSVFGSPTVADGTVYVTSDRFREDTGVLHALNAAHHETSDGSRVDLGTLGHVGDLAADDTAGSVDDVDGNETFVSLTDSSGDGIPDAVADANPVIPELVPIHGEQYARINISAVNADTTGDGILDNETIDVDYRVFEEDNETKLEATVVDAEHHPGKLDTSGDGLPDWRQLEGWNVYYTQSAEQSLDFLEAYQDADEEELEDLTNFEVHLQNDTVHADPMLADTRGNGLTDAEEDDLSTDPEVWDTTGDGVTDADALDFDGVDPTLHDFQGPDISVHDAGYDRNWFSTVVDYSVMYSAFDPSGLEKGRVLVDGDEKESADFAGLNDNTFHNFETSGLESINDAYTGAKVTVEAEDVHGNVAEDVAVERENIYGDAASNIGGDGLATQFAAGSFGLFSGTAEGAGDFAEFLAALATNWREFVPALEQVVAAIEAVTDLDDIIRAAPELIDQKQDAQNPFDPDNEPELYDSYQGGWYSGYSLWLVLEMALPLSEIGKIAKSSSKLQSAVDALDSSGDLRRAAATLESALSTAYSPVRYVNYATTRAVVVTVGAPVKATQKVLSVAPTAGARHALARGLQNVDPRTVRIAADGSGDLDASFRRGVARAATDDSLESYAQLDRAVRQVDELSGAHKVRGKRLVADADGDGIRLVDDLDDANLGRMLSMDEAPGYDGVTDWNGWRKNLARGASDADPEDVNRYVRNVRRAGESDVVSGEAGLVRPLKNDPTEFTGQRGEARRTVHYAEEAGDVSEVRVEPGDGDYDLAVTRDGEKEFIEIKTPEYDTTLRENYWDRQISAMNKKFDRSPDVDADDAVLEVPTKRSASELDFAESELRNRLSTRVKKNFGEVRIHSTDAETRIISLD